MRAVAPHGFRAAYRDGTPPTAHDGAGDGAVPQPAISSFERLTGIDLGFVPISRGPQVSETAARIGARAYTAGGTVHVPAEAGPLDSAEVEALLGHELAHVAQQRELGRHAHDGGELEAIAQAVERAVLDRLPQAPPPVPDRPVLDRPEPPKSVPVSEPDFTVMRAPVAEETSAPPPPETRPEFDGEQLVAQVLGRLRGRFVALNSQEDLDRLAALLYGRLRSQLRLELLVDRERAGVLTEFR